MMKQKIFKNLLKILRIVKNFYNNFEQIKKIVESTHRFRAKTLDVESIIQRYREKYRALHVCNFIQIFEALKFFHIWQFFIKHRLFFFFQKTFLDTQAFKFNLFHTSDFVCKLSCDFNFQLFSLQSFHRTIDWIEVDYRLRRLALFVETNAFIVSLEKWRHSTFLLTHRTTSANNHCNHIFFVDTINQWSRA